MAGKDVANVNANIPAHLQGGKTAEAGNLDSTDRIIPRVKLLQGTSPEVENGLEGARSGQFWHSIADLAMGDTLMAIPILVHKSYVLWAPRGDDRGILARASDGVNWDEPYPGMEFTLKPKKSPKEVTVKLGKTVHESVDGALPLSAFGSSIPGEENSPPMASLTYRFLWYFPDFQELSPAVIINTRSSVAPAKLLINKMDTKPVDHFGQKYIIGTKKEQSDDGTFNNYTYTSAGFVEDPDEFALVKSMFERLREEKWVPSDEGVEDSDKEGGDGKSSAKATEDSKKKGF